MKNPSISSSMRIDLSGIQRERIVRSLRSFLNNELDLDLSDFQAERVVGFFVRELGPPVYNQAIRDAHQFIQEKLMDLDSEFYEPEEPHSS